MNTYLTSVKTKINDCYDQLTNVEKIIADYFLDNQQEDDYSIKAVSQRLFVSEASLSRFAKKIGFNGYREFIFAYASNLNDNTRIDQFTEYAIHQYQYIVANTYETVDTNQMIRIARLLDSKKRVFVYGIALSGLVAKEFYFRFVRLGLDCDALTNENDMVTNNARLNRDSLVIGISIMGKTKETIAGLKNAKKKGATTILMTSVINAQHYNYCDEVIKLAYIKNLTVSHIISPQLPALMMLDIIYIHYLNYNRDRKLRLLNDMMDEINFKVEK